MRRETMMDVAHYRRDTPGCTHKVHFNNAGASLMPSPVLESISSYLSLEAITGGYETADLKAADLEGYYESMSRLLNCRPRNIAYTSSATNSFARALSCLQLEKGDNILIAREDYISNQLAFLSLQKRFGIQLLRAASLSEGGVDVDDLKRLIDKHRPKLVSLSHIPTNSGLIQPVEAVGKLCHEQNIPYLVDGCQSAGQIPLDVNKIHCDFLTGTFRKFMRGPRGAGFLFVSDSILDKQLEPMFLDMRGADWISQDAYKLRADARRFEDWENSPALVLGSKASADYALKVGLDEIQKRNEYLCKLVREKLTKLNLMTLDNGKHLSSIITVKIEGKGPKEVLQFLRDKNVNTSISNRNAAVIDFDAKRVTWALRISPHYYNTEEEVEKLSQALEEIVRNQN